MSDELARRKARQLKCTVAGMHIQQRLGGLDTRQQVEHVRIAALAAIAETRSLWTFLIERGLATEAMRQDYLDKGYDSLLAQVEGKAAELMVADG